MFYRLNFSYIFCLFLFFNSFFFNFLRANSLDLNETINDSQNLSPNYRRFISLPELRGVYVQDMTINEIYLLLNKKYSRVLKNPNLFISIKKYRPVKIFIKGEVKRPGLYTILGTLDQEFSPSLNNYSYEKEVSLDNLSDIMPQDVETFSNANFPTLYSAIKVSNGITPYSDLSKIKVTRKDTLSI